MAAAFGTGRVSLAKRLMVLIVLVSTSVAAVATGVQLYAEYRRDVGRLHDAVDQIEQSYLGSITENAWLIDRERLQTLVTGIINLPAFALATVTDVDGRVLASAGAPPADGLSARYPLVHDHRGEALTIGHFTVSADYNVIYAKLYQRALDIIAANFAKTLIVSLIIVWLIHRLVTRHVNHLADCALADGPHTLRQPFRLERPPRQRQHDELDDLVAALNKMRSDLADSYASLRTSEARYRDLFECSPVPIAEEDLSGVWRRFDRLRHDEVVADLKGWLGEEPHHLDGLLAEIRILRLNAAMQDLLGELGPASQPVQARPWMTDGLRAFFVRLLDALWDGKTQGLDEAPIIDRTGALRTIIIGWCTTTGAAANANHDRLVMSLIDITDRKTLETSLRRGVEELTRSNTELERFAYIASHDLREPIRSIVSYSQLLDRRYRQVLDETGVEFLGHITAAGERMYALVRDLLDYSRVGPSHTEFVAVDLNDCLASAMDMLRPALEEQRATVAAAKLPEMVRGNAVQLTTLFQNLLSNALKYHRPDVAPHVEIEVESRGEAWHILVQDNGIGLDMKYAEAVFEIFRRLHPADAYPGSGIGLAICRRIVQGHGGRMWLTSEESRGTTFHVILPRSQPESADGSAGTDAAAAV